MPHIAPRYIDRQERNATKAYRELTPVYRTLARRALASLALVAVAFVLAVGWNNRRLPEPVSRFNRSSPSVDAVKRVLAGMSGHSGAHQAGFWFTLQTLPRSVRHRTVLAMSFAVGVTLVVLMLRQLPLTAHVDTAAVPLSMLSAETMLLGAVFIGVRRAADFAADPRSSVTFDVAWQGDTRRYVSGVKRAAWISITPPVAAPFLLWHTIVIGPRVAVQHALVTGLWAMLWLQGLLRSAPPLAFAGEDDDEATLARSARRFAAMILFSLLLATWERYALAHGMAYLALVATLTTALWGTTVAACRSVPLP